MRFHLAEAMTAITNYIPLAQAAEAHGYSGYTIPDSLIYPEASDTDYGYTDDGDRSFLENKPFVEAFTLAALGAATERLELTTNVLKLPVRPPLYLFQPGRRHHRPVRLSRRHRHGSSIPRSLCGRVRPAAVPR